MRRNPAWKAVPILRGNAGGKENSACALSRVLASARCQSTATGTVSERDRDLSAPHAGWLRPRLRDRERSAGPRLQFLGGVVEDNRLLLGLLQVDEGDRAPDGGDPKRDRVVDEGGGGRDGSVDAIDDEHADQAAVEDADPAGHRNEVRQVADLVGQHHRGQRRHVTGGSEAREQHRDVEPQVADRPTSRQSGRAISRFVSRTLVAVSVRNVWSLPGRTCWAIRST